jgi:hypothetical protein
VIDATDMAIGHSSIDGDGHSDGNGNGAIDVIDGVALIAI